MYESPIELMFHTVTEDINQRINEKIEKDFYEIITVNYGINVSKEELLKALAYDRNQYCNGYQDAKREFQRIIDFYIRIKELYFKCNDADDLYHELNLIAEELEWQKGYDPELYSED